MTITVKPGDDIAWPGSITREGVTNFTGYTLTAEIREKDPVTGAPGALKATAGIVWVNQATGLFTLGVARTVTATWPVNACLLIDMRIASPDNKWVRTDTSEFKTVAGVTA